jgi:hypothetical protein
MEETMKKIIMFLMAATMIIGFAGISMAADECATCTAPGIINRACDMEQDTCLNYWFDYEDAVNPGVANYCDDPKTPRRVLFPACNCENFQEGDTIDIRMEILVNGLSGDNGAYWGEAVGRNGIQVGTYPTNAAACDPDEEGRYVDGAGNPGFFRGAFQYLYYDELGVLRTNGIPRALASTTCWPTNPELSLQDRVVIIQPNPDCQINPPGAHGFVITTEDDDANNAIWAINIPFMRFDMHQLQAGDVISVKICVAKANEDTGCVDLGGICGDTGCCCEFVVGTLGCCVDELSAGTLVYPYATPMNDVDWWYGFVITNLTDVDGVAEVTAYEGSDSATITVDVPARGMYVKTNTGLLNEFSGFPNIGDDRAYFEVNTDFTASGFLFIGNDGKSEAMGYVPTSSNIMDSLLQLIGTANNLSNAVAQIPTDCPNPCQLPAIDAE